EFRRVLFRSKIGVPLFPLLAGVRLHLRLELCRLALAPELLDLKLALSADVLEFHCSLCLDLFRAWLLRLLLHNLLDLLLVRLREVEADTAKPGGLGTLCHCHWQVAGARVTDAHCLPHR